MHGMLGTGALRQHRAAGLGGGLSLRRVSANEKTGTL